MNKAKILVVEDDKAVRNLITTTLETQNYQYHTAEKGSEALLEAVSFQPDVMLLDLGLPDMDGIAIIEKVRGWSGMPIIVISARSEDRDKIDALDAGADDYLTKPFSVDELLARLRVALRRARQDSGHAGAPEAVFTNGELTIDYAAGCTYLAGQEVHLTPHRVQAAVPAGKERGQGAHAQLHFEGGVGQRPAGGYAFAACVHGYAAQKDRAGAGTAKIHPDPCGRGLPDAAHCRGRARTEKRMIFDAEPSAPSGQAAFFPSAGFCC